MNRELFTRGRYVLPLAHYAMLIFLFAMVFSFHCIQAQSGEKIPLGYFLGNQAGTLNISANSNEVTLTFSANNASSIQEMFLNLQLPGGIMTPDSFQVDISPNWKALDTLEGNPVCWIPDSNRFQLSIAPKTGADMQDQETLFTLKVFFSEPMVENFSWEAAVSGWVMIENIDAFSPTLVDFSRLGYIQIKNPGLHPFYWQLIDLRGRIIVPFRREFNRTVNLYLDSLPKDKYLLKIVSRTGVTNHRFFIQ